MKRKFKFCKGKINKTGKSTINEYSGLGGSPYKVKEIEYRCDKCNHTIYNPVDDICLQRYIIK